MTTNDKQQELMRRALQELRELRAKLAQYEQAGSEAIAIVGVACRFPGGCDTPEALWDFLCAGGNAVSEVPAERWPIDDYYDPDPYAAGKISSRYGAFLKDIDYFDADFFSIPAREAGQMDPQQRLLLECSWQAFESAGLHPKPLRGCNAGVFIGCMTQEYSGLIENVAAIDVHTGTGNAPSVMAGRLAYFYGLQGPALVVDTACSSSLLAVHLAVKSLRSRETDLALAGGVNLQLSPRAAVTESRAMMLAPDGLCKTFADNADGIGRGDGVGVVVLKRLSDALRDADPIVAVIKGSAVNHDGRSSGLTVPSERAQVRVLKAALHDAGIDAGRVGYIEAHGTGTPLGDPIEVGALTEVFGERPHDNPLLLGSIKTNFGHTEGAAGIAGLIKAALMLKHQAIPPHLHLEALSSHIPWQAIPVKVVTAMQSWPTSDDQPRIAGVSAFGLSGTNVHVIVEQPPEPDSSVTTAENFPMLLKLSAHSAPSLTALAGRYQQWLGRCPDRELTAARRTAALCRRDFSERAVIAANDRAELAAAFAALRHGQAHAALYRGSAGYKPGLAMLFTGQGAQYQGMGEDLYRCWPVYRGAIDDCARHLDGLLDRSLQDLLFNADEICLQRTLYAQPCVFAVDYALYCLWRSWGVEPEAVIGHSLGEYVAACVAGVFTLADALRLVVARAKLMDEAPGQGAMLSVAAARDTLAELLGDGLIGLDMAAVNAPQHCVLSGGVALIAEVEQRLEEQNIACRRLNVAHAFHSVLMEPVLAPFRQVLESVTMRAPYLPIVSNVTGKLANAELTTPEYWLKHCRNAVLFADGIDALQGLGCGIFLECGPRPVLSALAAAALGGADKVFSSLRGGQHGSLMYCAAGLYVRGIDLNWDALFDDKPQGRRPVLPTYPFSGKRYWLDAAAMKAVQPVLNGRSHPLLQHRIAPADEASRRYFESELSLSSPPYLSEHTVHGHFVAPLAVLLEMLLAAAIDTLGQMVSGLRNVVIEQPLILRADAATQVQVDVRKREPDVYEIRIFSKTGTEPWQRHIGALAVVGDETAHQHDVPSGAGQAIAADAVYRRFAEKNIVYGTSFRVLEHISDHGQAAVTRLKALNDGGGYWLHPVLWDACLQTAGVAIGETGGSNTWLPAAIERVDFYRPAHAGLHCTARVTESLEHRRRVDVSLVAAGLPVAAMTGVSFQPVAEHSLLKALESGLDRSVYQVEWRLLDALQPRKARAGERVLCIGSSVAAALAEKLAAAGRQSALLTLAQLSVGIGASTSPLTLVYCAEDFAAGDDAAAALGFLKMIQALEARDITADVTVLTCNAAGLGQQASCPRQSAVIGLMKTAALEYPQRRWQALDIESTDDALLPDVLAGLDNEPQLALSENRCYAARLMPMTVRQPDKPVVIRKHRSYLVTGGAGALGFAVVEHLLARGADSIVIVGRSGLDSLNAEQRARLDAGAATITGVAADLGQDVGIARLLAALEGLPPLAGIVHAAGLLNDRVLSRMDEAAFRAPWVAKVDALRQLGEKLPTAALDFFVVFSSMAALTGSPGQGNYAAANAYVDAFMQARKQRGLAALSINWGPWKGGGMLDGAEALMAEKGIDSIAPEQGLVAFDLLLNSDAAQAAVMPIRWPVFLAALPKPSAFYRAMQAEQSKPVAVQGGLSGLLGAAEPAHCIELLERELRRLIAEVLRNPDSAGIEARQRFFDNGFDSLLAMDFTNRLTKDLALELPSTLLFDYPTLEALLGFLTQRLAFDAQTTAAVTDAFDDCSDEQLARLLMQRLDSLA